MSVESRSMPLSVRFSVPFLVAAVSLLPSAAKAAGEPQIKKTPFGIGADVGSGLVKFHKACFFFRVLFISDDFFKDLQEHETPNGIEFRKRKNKLTPASFPVPLIVDVEAIPWKCSTAEMTPPDYASGLMEGPSFEVAWKRGNEVSPVQLLAAEQHHHSLGLGWSYLLKVPSESIPLTDSLVIHVSLRHGICRMRMTANLDRRQRQLIPSNCD
jgi:hypothetical protein